MCSFPTAANCTRWLASSQVSRTLTVNASISMVQTRASNTSYRVTASAKQSVIELAKLPIVQGNLFVDEVLV